jgi:TldD protein
MIQRRDFLKASSLGAAALLLPPFSHAIAAEALVERIDVAVKKRLADAALGAARDGGASYCDVRIGRYLRQFINTREDRVENVVNTESTGVGVRVVAGGAWGFAATNTLTEDAVAGAARQALAVAKANAGASDRVRLAPVEGVGEVNWSTPIERNPMEVPIKEKVDLLLSVNAAAMQAGASFIASNLFQVNEQKYFASTDGSYIDQDVYRIWTPFTATAVDKASGKFRTRDGLGQPMGMGYEFLEPKPQHRHELPSGVVVYSDSYDMVADAVAAARDAQAKLKAPSVKSGKYDLVLDPSHLFLTIHESVGHPLELDRVLGYEANYAGTSFATLDKWRGKDFRYGSDRVNFVADRTQPHSLGAVGYDDEGVKAKRWDLVRDGILVDYQSIRDQAHVLGKDASDGCCYADSWASVQFQRMPNVSLEPGDRPLTPAQLVADVEDGIYIVGRGSYSIDQQRYNAQFGGQLFHEIKGGKVTRMIEDVAYQIRTPEFWNACSATCDRSDYRTGGSFFDGKGQPSQVSAVSHGSATTRFDGINVINTARSLG